MSPISFSDKFVLLSLKGSQNLIDKSSLGVVVDNIKLIDFFQHFMSLVSKAIRSHIFYSYLYCYKTIIVSEPNSYFLTRT